MTKLIEKQEYPRAYGFIGTDAIIETDNGKRFLICDGYGGENTIEGGHVRWKHGAAFELKPGDTFDSLHSTDWNDDTTLCNAVLADMDDDRPVVDFHPECFARSAGLID